MFRRQWSSLYEALQDSRPQRRKLMRLYIQQMNQVERPVFAGDHTIWARPFAVTLQERTYKHQATQLGNRPVGVGQGWSTLTWIPEVGSSWALPLRHERITSFESPLGNCDKCVNFCQLARSRYGTVSMAAPALCWHSRYCL